MIFISKWLTLKAYQDHIINVNYRGDCLFVEMNSMQLTNFSDIIQHPITGTFRIIIII